ncbi:MAG: hypothetical protein PHF86_08840 [Candidatus Nanoarchaeia archaeon]|nr:hypothetical protein [Candidatus Nanoarchaeia archaeon]
MEFNKPTEQDKKDIKTLNGLIGKYEKNGSKDLKTEILRLAVKLSGIDIRPEIARFNEADEKVKKILKK